MRNFNFRIYEFGNSRPLSLSLYRITSLPLYLCTSLPLYLCTSLPLYLINSVPLYLITSLFLYLSTSLLERGCPQASPQHTHPGGTQMLDILQVWYTYINRSEIIIHIYLYESDMFFFLNVLDNGHICC